MESNKSCCCSFLLYHNETESEDRLIQSIASYQRQKDLLPGEYNQIIVLLDHVDINEYHIFSNLIKKRNHIDIIATDQAQGPLSLWKKGIKKVEGNYLVCTFSGCNWYEDSLYHLKRKMHIEGKEMAYGRVCYREVKNESSYIVKYQGFDEPDRKSVKWANTLPLCYTLFKTAFAKKLFKGHNSTEHVNTFKVDWDICKSMVKEGAPGVLKDSTLIVYKPLALFQPANFTKDQVTTIQKDAKRLKIGIMSSILESTQVQLCLLNYFELAKDKVEWTWYCEQRVGEEELDQLDMIFFVRSRSKKALGIAAYCYKQGIKTIYILDDNWFCAVETYPQLEEQIGPSTVSYRAFILMISTVDHVITYNDIIKKDIAKYNEHVYVLPPNVHLEDFRQSDQERASLFNKDDVKRRVGFSGSTSKKQHFDRCFKDLGELMKEDGALELYFKGLEPEPLLESFGTRISYSEYEFDYKEYAKDVGSWQCPIMLSPLDDARYVNSKCPNKYLEITAAGACGIYTDCQLYRQYIEHNVNGLLIENRDGEWKKAIIYLLSNPKKAQDMYHNALEDVREHYATQTLVTQFIALIEGWFYG